MTVERGKGWEMHLGDCIEVMATLEKVDHVITDPPYEAEAHTKQRVKRQGRPLSVEPLSFAPITALERAEAGAHIGRLSRRWSLVFCQIEAAMLWRVAVHGTSYRRTCIWDKPDGMPQLTGDRPAQGYEAIVAMHAPGRSAWNGGGRSSVFTFNKNDPTTFGGGHSHPTQKPRSLMLELVSLFTDPDETVLDPFCGSASTGVACLRLGRKFVGIEKDPAYFALACERLRAEEQGSTLQAARAGQLPLLGTG